MDFQEVKRPLKTKSVRRPIKVGKRPMKEGKRPIKAMVLVGISVGCLMGCFRAPQPRRKTAPLKRPIKRSMNQLDLSSREHVRLCCVNHVLSAIQTDVAVSRTIDSEAVSEYITQHMTKIKVPESKLFSLRACRSSSVNFLDFLL